MVPAASPVTHVLLFAKAPHPGRVKTRLARDVGADRAAAIYDALAVYVARRVASASAVTVWCDPPSAVAEVAQWLGIDRVQPQRGADLGERLAHAFASHFAGPAAPPALAIGADAPDIEPRHLADAERALGASDIVLGPSYDGGYYLIGMRRHHPGVFAGVPWGTDRVLDATLERCEGLGLTAALVSPLHDVDTLADLLTLGLRDLTECPRPAIFARLARLQSQRLACNGLESSRH